MKLGDGGVLTTLATHAELGYHHMFESIAEFLEDGDGLLFQISGEAGASHPEEATDITYY